MFLSPSPLKWGQMSRMTPIDLVDYVSTESSHSYTSKLRWVDEWERWNSNVVDFATIGIEESFLNQILTIWNRNMSKEYHTHCTQELSCRYLDQLLILFEEIWFLSEHRRRASCVFILVDAWSNIWSISVVIGVQNSLNVSPLRMWR